MPRVTSAGLLAITKFAFFEYKACSRVLDSLQFLNLIRR